MCIFAAEFQPLQPMDTLIAFCGLDCAKCDAYTATKNNDQALRERTARLWSELNHVDILPEHIHCEGCRTDGAKTYYCSTLCHIRQCALLKGVDTCGRCPEMNHCPTVGELHANRPEARENLVQPVMETERILMRPWCDDDAPALFRHASDPEVGPRAGWPPHQCLDESRAVIRTLFNNDHTWAIILKQTSEPIGCICYYTPSESNISIGPHDAEAGYWVARPYWNRGIATEALRLLTDHCFRQLGIRTLWADHFPDNHASSRVMQKCGFRHTGRTNCRSHLQTSGSHPVEIMRLDNPHLT